jgi:hypothetical protein
MTDDHRIYRMSFASIYPLYIAKVERKGRTKDEVDQIILWLTGYTREAFEAQLATQGRRPHLLRRSAVPS